MRSLLLCMLLVISGAAVPGIAQPIEQMPGWPINMPGMHTGFRGVVFADLDSDADLEIILSDDLEGGLCAWDYAGNAMPGFPVTFDDPNGNPPSAPYSPQWPPSVGDLDGDGDLEIVALASVAYSYGGGIYAFDHQANPLPGFPVPLPTSRWMCAPTLADLDQDGQLEILACEYAYPDGYLHVYGNDGTEWGGNWPVQLDIVPGATPAVGDIDGDGTVEICVLSYFSAFLLETDGTTLPGWPVTIGGGDSMSYCSPVLADLDGDGHREIVFSVCTYEAGIPAGECHVYRDDGTAFPGWPQLMGGWSYCAPTVTDLEGDGQLEVLCGSQSSGVDYSCFWVWDINGNVRPGFPYMNSPASGNPGSDGPLTVADINGDGTLEIFADAYAYDYNTGEGLLLGVDSNGQDLPGFPLVTAGYTMMNGATIGDVDGDGHYELGVISNDWTPAPYAINVNLYTLPDSYAPTTRDWLTYHGSNCRGGVYPAVAVECPGDVDGDGDTDLADLAELLGAYGSHEGDPSYNPNADFDGDGDVDLADLAELLGDYGC